MNVFINTFHPCILKSIYRSDLTAKLGIFSLSLFVIWG